MFIIEDKCSITAKKINLYFNF